MLRHIRETRQGYFSHFFFASFAGVMMIVGGILSIVHAIIPDLFVNVAENVNRGLLEYAESRYRLRRIRSMIDGYEISKKEKEG